METSTGIIDYQLKGGIDVQFWKMTSSSLEEEELKRILPYFTFDEVPLKGYYNSEP